MYIRLIYIEQPSSVDKFVLFQEEILILMVHLFKLFELSYQNLQGV